MANSGVLYMKGMNGMESDDEMDEEEDIWDDRKLNDAYDKALKMANLEVAKRVAMATNTVDRKNKPGENSQSQQNQPKSNKSNKKNKQNKSQKKALKKESTDPWKEGMFCRAMYSADGFDYEATVLTILDDESCVIKYLGYNNTEIVPISSLQPTLGKQARRDQIMEAMAAKEDDATSTHSTCVDHELSDTSHVKRTPSSTKQRAPKNKRPDMGSRFALPQMPMPEVSSILREFGEMELPTPPPLVGVGGACSSDDQALSNMLVSWYMSGYYTGLYHGMRRSRQRLREC